MAKRNEHKKRKRRMASAICHLFGILIILAVIAALLPITVPKYMGYEVYNVISGSMEPEIPVGSAIYVQAVDPATIKEGDVIAFLSGGTIVMHRVVSNHTVEGYLITKGDANEEEDFGEVYYQNVRGIVAKTIPHLGQLMMILSGTVGKVLLFILALCGVLLYQLGGQL